MCHGQKSRFLGDGHSTFNDGNPYNRYINPYGIGLIQKNKVSKMEVRKPMLAVWIRLM